MAKNTRAKAHIQIKKYQNLFIRLQVTEPHAFSMIRTHTSRPNLQHASFAAR